MGRVFASLAAVTGVGALGFGYGLVEARMSTVRRWTLPVLPVGAPPLRVLHVSDIHLVAGQRAKLEWLASLQGLEPDLVVNTGDNFSEPAAIEPLLDAFGRLLDVPGVYVWGSNDYYAPSFANPVRYLTQGRSSASRERHRELPWRTLGDAFTQRGWHDLNHRRASLSLAGLRVDFRGTDAPHLDRDDSSLVAGPVDPAADLSVGLTHAPYLRLLDAMTADGVEVILAGHTHGGQVCVPGYGALVTNCDLDAARVKGVSAHEAGGHRAALHVSAGIGTSPFARYRFACRPEASLLTLVPRNPE